MSQKKDGDGPRRCLYVIEGEPTSWSVFKGIGNTSYNPRNKEKSYAQAQLHAQHKGSLFTGAVCVDFLFEVSIPKSYTKRFLGRVEAGEVVYCAVRPDLTNYVKFAEDCLSGPVLSDDNLVVQTMATKIYSLKPKTTIIVTEIYEQASG